MNVCIFSVALGKKLGLSRLQLYDLGMTALLHDVGKARVPIEILNKTTGLDETRVAGHAGPSLARRAHPVRACGRYDEIPYRAILVAHEHHMKTDLTGYPAARSGPGTWASSPASCRWPTASTPPRRGGATRPCRSSPTRCCGRCGRTRKRGYDTVLVKALINLIGIYPVGTCVILDTFEVGIVAAPNPEGQQLNRPLVRIAVDADGGDACRRRASW